MNKSIYYDLRSFKCFHQNAIKHQRNAHQADIHQAGPMVNSEDRDEVPQKCSV